MIGIAARKRGICSSRSSLISQIALAFFAESALANVGRCRFGDRDLRPNDVPRESGVGVLRQRRTNDDALERQRGEVLPEEQNMATLAPTSRSLALDCQAIRHAIYHLPITPPSSNAR
jgi:hypothetical protein